MLRAFDRWLLPYLKQSKRDWTEHPTWHVMVAVCDHFEPFHDTNLEGARKAMADWEAGLPALAERGYKHSFFYPVEQYHEEIIDRLAGLCRKTGSEVEVHLHHHHDTAAGLMEKLQAGKADLQKHGCLSKDRTGSVRFAFIHGNWALDNSGDADGRNCGVSDELGILRKEGCYADLTQPSAPHPTQTRTINSVYYAKDTPEPNSHDTGLVAVKGKTGTLRDSTEHLLMIQGPLGLNWKRRKWGVIPKVENAELSGANPWLNGRFPLWIELAPSVKGGAPWIFVKLHTHGGISRNYHALLGSPASSFQTWLTGFSKHAGVEIRPHFVTAREMTNLIHSAEDGLTGNPDEHRDYLYLPPR